MSTDTTPEPFHRWSANEDPNVRPFGLKDFCLVCRVTRYSPMSGERAEIGNAVAAGPCPQKWWREMTDAQIEAAVAAYLRDDA